MTLTATMSPTTTSTTEKRSLKRECSSSIPPLSPVPISSSHSPSSLASSTPTSFDFPPPKGYTFLERIGQGTFARVFRGLQDSTGELVAIKVVDKRPLSSRGLEHIMKEIEALWKLNHQNIMQMFDMIETDELLYIVTELCDGDLLRILLHRGAKITKAPNPCSPLSNPNLASSSPTSSCNYTPSPSPTVSFALPECLTRNLFAQLVEAMSYAHEQNYCHRDLKLENLFVTKDLVLKVGDWGFASNFTRTSYLADHCGSLPYAAPEIYMRQMYSGSEVDVWSIGVCLYLMVAGTFPFEATSSAELIRKIHQGEFFMPPWFSPELRHLINRFLEPVPSRRIKLEEVKQHPWMLSGTPHFQDVLPASIWSKTGNDCTNQQKDTNDSSSPLSSGHTSPCCSPRSETTSSPASPHSPEARTGNSSPPSNRHIRTPPEQPVTGTQGPNPDIEKGSTHEHNGINTKKIIETAITKGFTMSKLLFSQVHIFTNSQYNSMKGKAKVWRDAIESCLNLPLEVDVSFSDDEDKKPRESFEEKETSQSSEEDGEETSQVPMGDEEEESTFSEEIYSEQLQSDEENPTSAPRALSAY